MKEEATVSKPESSRQYLLEFIKKYGRDTNNSALPPQPVPLEEIKQEVIRKALWFGPASDWLDFIFARESLGTLATNKDKTEVIWVPQ